MKQELDLIHCGICGKECHYDTDNGTWIGTEYICEHCHNQLPNEIKQSLEDVNYEYAPNNVVDYINHNMNGDWVCI